MLYDAIELMVIPVASPGEAAKPFQRLGLNLSPLMRAREQSGGFHLLTVGGGSNRFSVELLAEGDAAEPQGKPALTLRVADLDAALAALGKHGVSGQRQQFTAADGTPIGEVARLVGAERAIAPLSLMQFAASSAAVRPQAAPHGLPLKRLDHLAAFTGNLEDATSFWTDVLGVPVHGEVRTPAMIIRQMKIGDAIFELLGPAAPDSPIASRPAGLASMIACEVDDVAAAVAQARAAGFTPNDPGTGALPGTRVATVPAVELGGLGLQLLQYV